MPKRQVLEDEILARLEGRSECFRESGDDLEHHAQSARDHCGRSTTPSVDGVLANDNYELSRTHLSLDKDAPDAREVQPPAVGEVVELPKVGGLHHRYERRAA